MKNEKRKKKNPFETFVYMLNRVMKCEAIECFIVYIKKTNMHILLEIS